MYFGKVKGQNRGEKPMDPPVVHDDPYYWMRDDKRKDSKVVRHLNRSDLGILPLSMKR